MMQEFAIYADALGEGPFMLGERMSAVDIYAAMLCSWAPDMGGAVRRAPRAQAHV